MTVSLGRYGHAAVLLIVACSLAACSLFAPSDEDLFGNKGGAAGAAGANASAPAGGTGTQ